MLMSSMSRYTISILFLLLSFQAFAQGDEDSVAAKVNADTLGQLRFGFDISKPLFNSFSEKRKSYELEVDYYWKKELYLVAEGGWGSSHLKDTALQFSSTNSFF